MRHTEFGMVGPKSHLPSEEATMAIAGLYRRVLPSPPAIDFGSPQGKMIFREALQDGTMEGFFPLIAHFQTQAEPAFCGLASLSVVLNALAIDPRRKWKGPWRWFDESMLECCESLEKVKAEGMTFEKVACAGACAGASVRGIRANESSVDEFRQHVLESCSSEDKHMIVSYDRKLLKQTGAGHFSPIGGYNRSRDLALILDVARFKYPPHWISLTLLWKAVETIDSSTADWRGFLLLTKSERRPSILFTLSCKDESWRSIPTYLIEEVPNLLGAADIQSTHDALSVILGVLPGDGTAFVKWFAEVRRVDTKLADTVGEDDLVLRAQGNILEELRKTVLYLTVSDWAKNACMNCPCAIPSLVTDELSDSLRSACCHGAASLFGVLISPTLCHIKTSGTKTINNGTKTQVVVGNPSACGGMANNVDLLIPTSVVLDEGKHCIPLHPASSDILTMLLFALPPSIWFSIRNKDVQSELLASVTDLPISLQIEAENLREQLHLVHKWRC